MQKKIIALAVAGLVSGAAFAQSNVTIYGIADVGLDIANSGYGTQTRVQSGQSAGSRIGFKGEEALGNGLKAEFVLESGVNLDTGSISGHTTNVQQGVAGQNTAPNQTPNTTQNAGSTIFSRQAYAGLKSATLGGVYFGKQYTPGFTVKAKADAFGLGMSPNANNVYQMADRFDNAVTYKSPVWAGFSGQVAYSSGQEDNGTDNGNATTAQVRAGKAAGIMAQYDNGPVWVGGSYHDVNGVNFTTGTGTAPAATKEYLLGASYDFKVVKAYAGYGARKTTQEGTEGKSADNSFYNVGVTAPFGAHKVLAQYSRLNDKLTADADFSVYGVGYEYAMSKRTALYAAYARGENKNAGTSRLNSALTNGLTPIAGYDGFSVTTGVRHSF
jgi:GBP family porin